ncbi:MAG: hypothetical protein MN733_36690, partial [Nitrososphaera sp.]|nr:hypothetical protein [Nitrososphaera sp.]
EQQGWVAEFQSLLVQRLGDYLGKLGSDIETTERNIGKKLEKLATELEKTRNDFHSGSEAAIQQTGALVRWTRALVLATFALALLTAGLVYVAHKEEQSVRQALEVQVEPQLQIEITSRKPIELVIRNNGAYPVLNISIFQETTTFMDPYSGSKHSGPVIVGTTRSDLRHPWQHIDKLLPGDIHTLPLADVIKEQFGLLQMQTRPQGRNKIPGLSLKERNRLIRMILHFQLSYQREVDRKTYRRTKSALLAVDDNTGSPFLQDTRMMESIYSSLREVLDKVSDEEHLYRR